MSDGLQVCNSRTAMTIAFKRARRIFDSNVHQSETERDVRSEVKETSCDRISDPNNNNESHEDRNLEALLIDNLEQIEISDVKHDILWTECHHRSENSESVSNLTPVVRFDNIEDRMEEIAESSIRDKCGASFPNIIDRDGHGFDKRLGVFWKEDFCENVDSESNEHSGRTTRNRHERGETHRKKIHRCKRIRRSSNGHSCPSLGAWDLEHSPSCPYYEHCSCYHRHCCCCAWRCRWCSNRHDRGHVRSSTHRRTRVEKCSKCRRRSESPGNETRSHDSGCFANPRHEDDDYLEDENEEEEEEEDAWTGNLLHKDSLPIIQEKYASSRRTRR